MFSKIVTLASVALGSVAATWTPSVYQYNVDNSTYANADQIHTTHYHCDWKVDFDKKTLRGSITHDLEVLQDTSILVLDTWLIDIITAEQLTSGSAERMRLAGTNELEVNGVYLAHEIEEVNPLIGDALTIHFNEVQLAGTTVSVRVHYETTQ